MKAIFGAVKGVCNELGLNWVVLGGDVLLFYKVIRSTVGLDISVHFESENELQKVIKKINKRE